MNITVLSRADAERYQPPEGSICISVNERKMSFAQISRDYDAVLRLVFDDIDDGTYGGGVIPFQVDHAKKIFDFVQEHEDATEIVIHCTAGVSRSPGIALGILDAYDETPTTDEEKRRGWSLFNRRVRSTMRAVDRTNKITQSQETKGNFYNQEDK